ncbi:hypothetical protein B0J11DRAFT_574982 [Dendryphion nanum]|uniref:SCP domain-containing protein n=1 Tax=Dendryphion nanum TaxID=256645 RepID=A0A9P9ELC9_9PLEO|nr:hypothetical protein B0J11DRAFT_574982 [Dendryphion nanum]
MFKSIAVLALAGSAIARPALEARKLKTVVHTVVVTKTEIVTYTGVPKPSSQAPVYTPTPEAPKPAPSSKKEEYVVVTPTPKPSSKAPEYTPAPKPSSTQVYAPPAPPANNGYAAIVDEYRKKLGLGSLTVDSKLEANARDTAIAGNGDMVHKLNPGTFAQVLAPGSLDNFKSPFLGAWLCERPDLPGIAAECPAAMQGWIHTSTGHVDIITSKSYTKYGCADSKAQVGGKSILCCDFA